jgi:hypothetical protein
LFLTSVTFLPAKNNLILKTKSKNKNKNRNRNRTCVYGAWVTSTSHSWPMDQVQVDVLGAELLKALFARSERLLVPV